jgi:hypothetical protein
LKATLESALTSKDLVINIYHHDCYNNPLSKSPSSKEIAELPANSDFPTSLTELPGEGFQQNPEGCWLLMVLRACCIPLWGASTA